MNYVFFYVWVCGRLYFFFRLNLGIVIWFVLVSDMRVEVFFFCYRGYGGIDLYRVVMRLEVFGMLNYCIEDNLI